jgi:hypothetical protein
MNGFKFIERDLTHRDVFLGIFDEFCGGLVDIDGILN